MVYSSIIKSTTEIHQGRPTSVPQPPSPVPSCDGWWWWGGTTRVLQVCSTQSSCAATLSATRGLCAWHILWINLSTTSSIFHITACCNRRYTISPTSSYNKCMYSTSYSYSNYSTSCSYKRYICRIPSAIRDTSVVASLSKRGTSTAHPPVTRDTSSA